MPRKSLAPILGGGGWIDFARIKRAALAEALACGAGIGNLPPIMRPTLLASGALIEVIANWRFRSETLSMLWLSNRHVPKSLRLFVAFAEGRVEQMFSNLPR